MGYSHIPPAHQKPCFPCAWCSESLLPMPDLERLSFRVRPECMNTSPGTVPRIPSRERGHFPLLLLGAVGQQVQGLKVLLSWEKCSFRGRTTRGWVKHFLPISVLHQGSEPPKHHLQPCSALPARPQSQNGPPVAPACPELTLPLSLGPSRSRGSCSVAPRQGSLGLSPRQTGLKM